MEKIGKEMSSWIVTEGSRVIVDRPALRGNGTISEGGCRFIHDGLSHHMIVIQERNKPGRVCVCRSDPIQLASSPNAQWIRNARQSYPFPLSKLVQHRLLPLLAFLLPRGCLLSRSETRISTFCLGSLSIGRSPSIHVPSYRIRLPGRPDRSPRQPSNHGVWFLCDRKRGEGINDRCIGARRIRSSWVRA